MSLRPSRLGIVCLAECRLCMGRAAVRRYLGGKRHPEGRKLPELHLGYRDCRRANRDLCKHVRERLWLGFTERCGFGELRLRQRRCKCAWQCARNYSSWSVESSAPWAAPEFGK